MRKLLIVALVLSTGCAQLGILDNGTVAVPKKVEPSAASTNVAVALKEVPAVSEKKVEEVPKTKTITFHIQLPANIAPVKPKPTLTLVPKDSASPTIQEKPSTGIVGTINKVDNFGNIDVVNTSATAPAMVLTAGSTGVNILAFGLKANPNEDIRIEEVQLSFLEGVTAVKTVALYDGTTKLTSDVSLLNGVAYFKDFSTVVVKNTTKNLWVKVSTTDREIFPTDAYLRTAVSGITAVGMTTGIRQVKISSIPVGNVHTLQTVKAIVTPANSTPFGMKTPQSSQEIGTMDITAVGQGDLYVNSLNFQVNGSYTNVGTLSHFELFDGATKIALGTNETSDSTGKGISNGITFSVGKGETGFVVPAGTTKTVSVRANTSAVRTDATTNPVSVSLMMDGPSVEYSYQSKSLNFVTATKLENLPFTFSTLQY